MNMMTGRLGGKRILPLTGTEPEEEDAMDDPTREIAREKKRQGERERERGGAVRGQRTKILRGSAPSKLV